MWLELFFTDSPKCAHTEAVSSEKRSLSQLDLSRPHLKYDDVTSRASEQMGAIGGSIEQNVQAIDSEQNV